MQESAPLTMWEDSLYSEKQKVEPEPLRPRDYFCVAWYDDSGKT